MCRYNPLHSAVTIAANIQTTKSDLFPICCLFKELPCAEMLYRLASYAQVFQPAAIQLITNFESLKKEGIFDAKDLLQL